MKRSRDAALALTVTIGAAGSAWAASAVQGRLTSDGVTGQSILGHGWTEEIIQLSAWTTTSVGGGCNTLAPPLTPGWYSIAGNFAAGDYGLFTLSFDGIPAFSYSLITLPGGGTVVDPVELRTAAHYSVMYNQGYNEWGAEPWKWGSNFYQTFVATQPHITRLATKLAGKEGDHWSMTLNFTICQPNGGPPSTWPQLAPVRSYFIGGNVDPIIHIFWVPYKSNELTLTLGQTYALRVWSAPGSQATNFAVVARPITIGNQYVNGNLYIGDTAEPGWDMYAYVSGGTSGTIVNHAPIGNMELTTLVGSSTRYGQRFQASGTSLAGVEVPYATGEPNPTSIPATFQLYDAVGGNPIGPARASNGVSGNWQARIAASWPEGAVPTTPGQMYYLEWTTPGFNTWRMVENLIGEGYVNRVSLAPVDLMMVIAEYKQIGPTIDLDPPQLTREVEQGANLPPDTFTVRNSGSGTIAYTISDNANWLGVSPTSGSSTGELDTITVTYDTDSLPIGPHAASITVSAVGALNTPQTVEVSLQVKPHPGDFDLDSDVDLVDFSRLQRCLSGPGFAQTSPQCLITRLDADEDVDNDDLNIFLGCLSGAGISPAPGCGG